MRHDLAHAHVLLLGFVPSLGGCQGPDISTELDTYTQLVDDTNLLRCDCPQDLGFDTKAECDQAIGYARDYLACANAALPITTGSRGIVAGTSTSIGRRTAR